MEEGEAIIVYVLAKGKKGIFHCVFFFFFFFLVVCVILCFNVF